MIEKSTPQNVPYATFFYFWESILSQSPSRPHSAAIVRRSDTQNKKPGFTSGIFHPGYAPNVTISISIFV